MEGRNEYHQVDVYELIGRFCIYEVEAGFLYGITSARLGYRAGSAALGKSAHDCGYESCTCHTKHVYHTEDLELRWCSKVVVLTISLVFL